MTGSSGSRGPGDPGATPAADVIIVRSVKAALVHDAAESVQPFAFGDLSAVLRELDRHDETPRQYAERVGLLVKPE